MMMYHFVKRTVQFFTTPFFRYFSTKERKYRYKDIHLIIKPGVFHPAFFFSTKFLLRELKKESLKDKTFLELGAGSGLISFYAAEQGAFVTSTDINPIAIEGLKENLINNKPLSLTILFSDLFDSIPKQLFNYIIINPPYYPKNAKNDAERAWFCGEHFEYFEKLFSQLHSHMQLNTEVWLSLSEDCNITQIEAIAARNKYQLILKVKKRIIWEENFIYLIKKLKT